MLLRRIKVPALVALVLLVVGLAGPLRDADGQNVRLNWSADGQRCWYYVSTGGHRDYYLVDVEKRSREAAFDKTRLAESLSSATGEEVSADNLAIDRLELTSNSGELLVVRKRKVWRVDLASCSVEAVDSRATATTSGKLFLPPRGSVESVDETEISIRNALDSSIQLFWVDANLHEWPYRKLAPDETSQQHTYVGHVWLIKSDGGKQLGCFTAEADMKLVVDEELLGNVKTRERRGAVRGGDRSRQWRSSRSAKSPDGKWECFVRDDNLWARSGDQEHQLSDDGTDRDSYDPLYVRWSPDSAHVMAFRTKVAPERKVYLVESSPEDQLQPKLDSYSYRKPGDDLPTPTTCLFSVESMKQVPVDGSLMANPWSLRFQRWSEAGDRFYLHYNQRGHQHLRVLEVIAATGSVSAVIDESNDTFLHYSDSGKSVFEWLGDEILWASERSGWNHLYRYSVSEKKLLGAVTQGQWNVKRVVDVDQDRGVIWLYAVGLAEGQDPYHEHFCRVDLKGGNFRALTEGDGTHQIEFQQDRRFFIDRWSRVDCAPVQELRDSETGQLISELTRDDTMKRFTGRRLTERLVAKGRDGETEIWGIIHWPANFDPTKRYPVVENIYAGPHDHHVPKAFRARFGHQHKMADAGCIVVQIDGMGTAWRSKAFHDVCYKKLRDAGFPDRIAWMKAAAEKHPQMDLSRVGIYGGSAGGQNAMAALLWHNDFYKVAVADCGCHDNRMDKIWWNEQWMGWPVDDSYKANSNMENAHLLKGQLMLIVGERDHNVDPATTTQVVRRLIDHDKDFEFVLVPGVGHGAAENPWASRKRLRFLAEHLGMESFGTSAPGR